MRKQCPFTCIVKWGKLTCRLKMPQNSEYLLQHCWLFHTFAPHWWATSSYEAARMVESVDTKDLKSFGQWWLCGFKSRFEYSKNLLLICWLTRDFSFRSRLIHVVWYNYAIWYTLLLNKVNSSLLEWFCKTDVTLLNPSWENYSIMQLFWGFTYAFLSKRVVI